MRVLVIVSALLSTLTSMWGVGGPGQAGQEGWGAGQGGKKFFCFLKMVKNQGWALAAGQEQWSCSCFGFQVALSGLRVPISKILTPFPGLLKDQRDTGMAV